MIKRGELTTEQLITLILAIAGFVIVLVVFGLLFGDDSDLADTELCRLAVLSRATAPDLVSASLPLKCVTSKVCITNGEECKQFAGEKGVIDVNLEGNFGDKKTRIEEILANGLYDCWNMMGRGHLDLFGKGSNALGLDTGSPTCVVCRRVAFADDVFVGDDAGLKEAINVDRYMERNNVPGTEISYLSAMSDGGENTFSANRVTEITNKVKEIEDDPSAFSGTNDGQIAFVFSQVKSTDIGDALVNYGLAGTGVVFMPGVSKVVTKIPIIGTLALIGGGALTAGNAYLGQLSSAAYCGEFESSLKVDENSAQKGCSLVQAVPYNVQDINNLCPGSIQGSP